jgi:hypothetical protein
MAANAKRPGIARVSIYRVVPKKPPEKLFALARIILRKSGSALIANGTLTSAPSVR